MNKVIPTLIMIAIVASPVFAENNYQIQQGLRREVQQACTPHNNYQQPTYQSNQSPSMQYGSQPITRAEYPITVDQQYQSPYVYNP
jgi:hypothetical protein